VGKGYVIIQFAMIEHDLHFACFATYFATMLSTSGTPLRATSAKLLRDTTDSLNNSTMSSR
jgi:hypothetical protein